MFCYQCEQTAGCTGCTGKAGVCGKKEDTAKLQDQLTGALIGLANLNIKMNNAESEETDLKNSVSETENLRKASDRIIIEGLFATLTNVNFDNAALGAMLERAEQLKQQWMAVYSEKQTKFEPDVNIKNRDNSNINNENAGKAVSFDGIEVDFTHIENYDMNQLWQAEEDIRSLKSLILFGIRGIAAYAYHALVLGYENDEVNRFLVKALVTVGSENLDMPQLLPVVMEVGEINFKCMAMLDKANTETFGHPQPTEVSLTVEKGPFIVISGHDLYDLKLLLEQTKDKSINIYTHGEMLPAHAYPELKKYPHLKGNYGTAWQNQQKEFANLPAPVLFTTNCLMPPKESYADRVFTTEVVGYPGMQHIGEDKDFTPVIEKALALGGFEKDTTFAGINGGTTVMTGFARNTVLSVADTVVDAVKNSDIKHFFLVAGCDGSRPGRNYYTEFVKQTPKDTVVLTLACGKYRFNDLELGTIGGLPRLMDIGQCNDAYSAIQIALALANVFDCDVNELPLSMILSWYEQKAVCILLTLLHLGIKNIRLGPTLPAFISPNVLNFLVEQFGIAAITTPEEDLKAILR